MPSPTHALLQERLLPPTNHIFPFHKVLGTVSRKSFALKEAKGMWYYFPELVEQTQL